VVCTLGFGLAPSFGWAVFARVAWGLLNGNVGVAKTVMSELVPDAYSARAFSFIGLNTGFGRLLGPALGGMLSSPAEKWGWRAPLFIDYPFLLPCLAAAGLTAVTLALVGAFLEETRDVSMAEAAAAAAAAEAAALAASTAASAAAAAAGASRGAEREEEEGDGGEGEGAALIAVSPLPRHAAAPAAPPLGAHGAGAAAEGGGAAYARLLRDPAVRGTITLYCLLGLVGLISQEVYPLYMINDAEHGGFSFDAAALGLINMSVAPALILFQAAGFERAAARVGMLRLQRLSLLGFSVMLATTPMQSWALRGGEALRLLVVGAHFWVTTLVRVTSFTALFILVANSALPEDRAKVNGLGQAAVSVVRAVGPPLVTPLFAWTVGPWNNAFGFPLNYWFTWLLMAAFALGSFLFARTLPGWLERKRLRTDA
jgi:hypothetical protein